MDIVVNSAMTDFWTLGYIMLSSALVDWVCSSL